MKFKKVLALAMAATMVASFAVGCTGNNNNNNGGGAAADIATNEDGSAQRIETEGITDMTMFIAMPGSEINAGNEIQEIIAEKTGVRVKETWLTGQTAEEAIGTIMAGGDLPDFMDAGDGSTKLYEAGMLVAWDEYLELYPNLKEMYTDKQWDNFRMSDGKIYWANVFNNTYGAPKSKNHGDEAFWIQCRVLEDAGYPTIETMDEYFDVLEKYYDANPTFTDPAGNVIDNIPYTILCDDWRYFCLENAPEFLDGYPNDGSVIVDKSGAKPTIVDYNTTDTAYKYFKKLNEEYNKGYIDKEFATQIYDEYIAKLSTGAVLGMIDQNWDFNYTITPVFQQAGLDELGCNYIPLGITIEKGMDNRWHTYGDTLNMASGVCVTTSCENPNLAFQFMNDLLSQEIHDLRFWGVEGTDYLVDADGLYYRTEEMRNKANEDAYKASHYCMYSYFPQWGGTSRDGINAMQPGDQYSEFVEGLADPVVKVFEAYGVEGYAEMIGSVVEENEPWFPMYSYSNNIGTETAGGVAWTKMGQTKHEWLPKVVMAADFETEWANYMEAYAATNPQDFLDEMQVELDRRIEAAK